MKKNIKRMFFVTTLLILLVGLSAISAADASNDTIGTSQQDVVKEVNVEKVLDTQVTDTSTKNIKKEVKTHIVNNDTVKNVFSNTGKSEYIYNNFDTNTLNDSINEGDILDFQGTITGNYNLTINKPVNIISSTNDALINLNTSCVGLVGSDPGNSFSIISSGSYSNITNITFYNTQLFVINATHVTLDHINATVNGNKVGGGVGQTSIRENSTYITVKNSHFYTKDNGGSSTLVLGGAEYCTIFNNTINAAGNAGNLFYITKWNVYPEVNFNGNNRIFNNTIGEPGQVFGGIMLGCVLDGSNNTVESNTIYGGIDTQYGGAFGVGYTIINNNTCAGGINMADTVSNYTIINNVFGGHSAIMNNSFIKNNTFDYVQYNINVITNCTLINNTITGELEIIGKTNKVNISNNNIHNITIKGGKGANIEYCNITGLINITKGASNVKIINNNISSTDDYAITIFSAGNTIANNTITSRTYAGQEAIQTKLNNIIENNTPDAGLTYRITDENYNQFFNNEGIFTYNVKNYSTIILQDEFNNKDFKFENIILNINGENNKLTNTSIQTNNKAVIKITNITIDNKNTDKTPILFNADVNSLYNNTITTTNVSSEILVVNGMTNIVNNTFNINNANKPIIHIKSNNNKFLTNDITVNSNKKLNYIEIDDNTEYNLFSKNNIATISTTDVTLFNSKNSSSINITQNNINITTEANAYAISFEDVNKTYITYNKINISADKIEVIKTTSDKKIREIEVSDNTINTISQYLNVMNFTNVEDLDLESNMINASSNRSIGIVLDNCRIYGFIRNFINISNLETTDSINDMNTVYYLENIYPADNIYIYPIETENSALLIVKNVNNSIITGYKPKMNTKNNNGIYLINCNNLTVHDLNITTNTNYTISMINSSNNNISGNSLITDLNGGDYTVFQDDNSKNNTIYNNTPVVIALTDDNYDTYFDENNTIRIQPNYINIGSDIYNKTLIINNPVSGIRGLGNYTLYNSTIIINTTSVEAGLNDIIFDINNINFDNYNKTAIIINYIKGNINYTNSIINTYGEDTPSIILESKSNNRNGSFVNITNTTINLNSNNNFINSNELTCIALVNNNININNSNSTLIKHFGDYLRISDNTITGNAKEFILLNSTVNYQGALKTSLISNNIINIKTETPKTMLNIDNATGVQVINNNIIVETSFGDIPLIYMNASNASKLLNTTILNNKITDNYILCYDNAGDNCVKVFNITVENNTPYKTLKVDTKKFTIGQTTTIQASIYNDIYIATNINKGKVTFKVNGKTLKDVNGKVIYAKVVNGTATIENYEVPQDWTKEGTTIQAVYSGSSECDKLTSEKTEITIQKSVPILTTEDITATTGGKITLKATITDNNKVINTGKIVFKINGKTVKDENGKVIYAKVVNNIVEFEYTLPNSYKAGSYNITATFISADYDRLTDSKTLTITA